MVTVDLVSGYFAEDSMAVQVMGNRAVGLTYGQRALVIGATCPPLFIGTMSHTSRSDLPYTRLTRTARLFEVVFLGDKEEADRALAYTAKRHATVTGELTTAAGPHFPHGTPYSATDPHLMYLTMAFAFDSALAMQELLVRRLSHAEREALYADFVRWAELFGMPRQAAPATYDTFRADTNAYYASDRLWLTDQARAVGSYLVGARRGDYTPPPPLRPLFASMRLVVLGSLPQQIREVYGLEWTPAQRLAFEAVRHSTRAAYRRPPAPLRGLPDPTAGLKRGSNQWLLAGVARAERWHLSQGRHSMPDVAAQLSE